MSKKRSAYRFLSVLTVVLIILLVACTAITPTGQPQATATMNTNDDHSTTSAPTASSPTSHCQIQGYTLSSKGTGAAFKEPDVVNRTANGAVTTTLTVRYGDNFIGECKVHLRSYNGKLVGPTLRARPGDTLRITLKNDLPHEDDTGHVTNTIGMLNHTNLHTHGLHVSPVGNSDNVLLDIEPGETFEYEIKIPPDHTPGTYWYHAHMHGSTATQVSSGMAGALIIMGDEVPNTVDALPEVKAAAEKVFVIQQIVYDEIGVIEPTSAGGGNFPSANPPESITYFGPCNWEPMKREHTINGQLFPTLTMAPGEVQRWRLIDAGIRESIGVEMHGPYTGTGTPTIQDVLALPIVNLNEIAVDGIALNKVNAWNQIELEPGYRSDVLVQINRPGKYYLVDDTVDQVVVTQDPVTGQYSPVTQSSSFSLTCPTDVEDPSFLATIEVKGAAKNMKLPTTAQMAKLPLPYKPIIEINPAKTHKDEPISPYSEYAVVLAQGETIDAFQKVDFTVVAHPPIDLATPGPVEFMAADHPFDAQNARRLTLGNTEEWVLNTQEDSLYYAHPFHIHVNPFQTWRYGPDGKTLETVWRDTLLVQQGITSYIFTRYEDYIGSYVYHCHILDHEDQGMMELVEIVNP